MPGSEDAIAPFVFLVLPVGPHYARSTPIDASALVADTRVDNAVDQIDEKVHCRQEHSVKEYYSEDHCLILDLHAGNKEFAHTWDVEDLLHKERTGPDRRKNRSDERDDGNESVLQHMFGHNTLLGQS